MKESEIDRLVREELSRHHHTFGEWARYRWGRLTGRVPWWWECDRRACSWWGWTREAETLYWQTKREGLF